MSNETGAVSPTDQAAEQAQQVSETGKAGPKGSGTTGDYTMSTKIGTMAELKEKAPKVYQETLKGIAMQITSQMRRHAEKLKKLMREASRDKR